MLSAFKQMLRIHQLRCIVFIIDYYPTKYYTVRVKMLKIRIRLCFSLQYVKFKHTYLKVSCISLLYCSSMNTLYCSILILFLHFIIVKPKNKNYISLLRLMCQKADILSSSLNAISFCACIELSTCNMME